jgi:hypothetical protein
LARLSHGSRTPVENAIPRTIEPARPFHNLAAALYGKMSHGIVMVMQPDKSGISATLLMPKL